MTRLTELRTLQVSLPYLSPGTPVTLHVGRRRHPLQPHSPHTLARHRESNRALRLVSDHTMTHFVEDVELPSDCAQLLFVSTPASPGNRLPTLHLTKVHVPRAATAAAVRARFGGARRSPLPGLTFLGVEDDGADDELPIDVSDFTTAYEAACQACFQHLEMVSVDPTTAATVLQIIYNSTGLGDLAQQIYEQASATGDDTSSSSNWVYETPYTNPTGTPVTYNGSPVSGYAWSAATLEYMTAPMRLALREVKNTPSLQSSSTVAGCYTVQNGVTAVTSSQGASDALLTGPHLTQAAPAPDDSGGYWTVNDLTPQNGFSYDNDLSFDNGVFSASFTNSWLRWLSGYVEFLGPDGAVVTPAGWTTQLPEGVPSAFESDTQKYVAMFSSVDTILAIPVDSSPVTISFTWPSNATAVRVLAGGIGRTGGVEGQGGQYYGSWDGQVCAAGALMTGVFNFGLPVICLCAGAALDESTLNDLAKGYGAAILDAGQWLVTDVGTSEASNWSTTTFLVGFADAMPHLLLDAAGLAAAIDVDIAAKDAEEGAVEEACPVFGWIAMGLSVLTTIADLIETSVEVASSPATFEVVFTRAIDAQWTLEPDPDHPNTWPLDATSYSVTATFTDGTTRITTGAMTDQHGDITVEFNAANKNQLPAGGTVVFAANFYSESGWLCGSATSQPLSADVTGDVLTVPTQAIKENEVPLTSETRYGYDQSLGWDADTQQHVWVKDAQPTAPVTSLDPSNEGATIGALGQITVNEPESQVGYDWQASAQDLPVTGAGTGPTNEQLYVFQTVSIEYDDAEEGLRFVPSGFVDGVPVAYGLEEPASGMNYYIDPTDQLYNVRQIVLDGSSGTFTLPDDQSFGRFNEPIDACTIHPSGYGAGVNTENAKLEILAVPTAATTDAAAPLANIYAGYGVRAGLLHLPVGIAPTVGSGVIVLENTDPSQGAAGAARLQAFDLRGNPALIFDGASIAPLQPESQPVTALAIATESEGYIYVLKYLADGSLPEDYLLDVYTPDGAFLCQTPGLAAGSIAVDLWRNVYTLDYAQIAKPPGLRPEPSMSWWAPSAPQ